MRIPTVTGVKVADIDLERPLARQTDDGLAV